MYLILEHYSEFQPHMDDENALSSADYIYVYSLLLHFSCVKYPVTYFHDICKKLSDSAQQSIASFFKILLECKHINRETLRHTIAEVTVPKSPSPRNNIQGINRTESPVKTPSRHSIPTQKISPSTPKSFLLEERTRELYNLRVGFTYNTARFFTNYNVSFTGTTGNRALRKRSA